MLKYHHSHHIYPTDTKCTTARWRYILIFTILILFTNSILQGVACENIIQSKSIYTFGLNNEGQAGRVTFSSGGISISYNSILDKVLSNGSLSWQVANEGLVGSSENVSVNLKQIVKGFSTFFFIVEYSNLTSSQSLGEYIFAVGSNQNGQAALLYPPYLLTEPELLYIYTSAGKSENPFIGKTIKQMACVYSCLILTSDGVVYRHAGETYNHYATGRWLQNTALPNSYQDPDTLATLSNVKYEMVAVGGGYGLQTFFAVTNYGHVFSFGEYTMGLRGTPSSVNADVPTLIPGLRNITFIAASVYSTGHATNYNPTAGAVTKNGELWTWGSNSYGQMGVNNVTLSSSETPQQAIISNVKSIVFGYGHLLILLKDGALYGCGDNSNSEVTGIPTGPLYIPTLVNIAQSPVQCSLSYQYTACVMNDGKLYTWGVLDTSLLAHSDAAYYYPTDVPNNENTTFVQIVEQNGVAFTATGHSVVWGKTNADSLGALGDEKQVRFPTKLSTPSFIANSNITVQRVVSSNTCTVLLSRPNTESKNTMEYWGPCSDGMSFSEPTISPYQAPSSLTNLGVVDVSYNIDFAIALTSGGNVYGWGSSANSNMGLSDETLSSETLVFSGDVKLICAGSKTSFILLNNGTLFGVGWNGKGELGLGHTSLVSSYTAVNTSSFLSNGETIVDMKTGEETTYILTSLGNVYGAGSNIEGYISSSGDSNFDHFILVNSPVKIKKISVGFYQQLMAISTTGDAYYFAGAMYKIAFPSNDSYIVDLFGYARSYYFITKRGSVYTSGRNTYYQTSSQKGLDDINIIAPKLYVSRFDLDGIPYTGAAGEGRATLITRYEYTCNGVNSTEETVCSSRGYCSAPDQCECFNGYSGSNCEYFYCNGIEKSNTSYICSGRGTCTGPNVCSSCVNSIGTYCENNLCFGISQNDTMNVCGGRGQCIGYNSCQCNQGYYGDKCQYESCFASLTNSGLKRTSIADRFCQDINKYFK